MDSPVFDLIARYAIFENFINARWEFQWVCEPFRLADGRVINPARLRVCAAAHATSERFRLADGCVVNQAFLQACAVAHVTSPTFLLSIAQIRQSFYVRGRMNDVQVDTKQEILDFIKDGRMFRGTSDIISTDSKLSILREEVGRFLETVDWNKAWDPVSSRIQIPNRAVTSANAPSAEESVVWVNGDSSQYDICIRDMFAWTPVISLVFYYERIDNQFKRFARIKRGRQVIAKIVGDSHQTADDDDRSGIEYSDDSSADEHDVGEDVDVPTAIALVSDVITDQIRMITNLDKQIAGVIGDVITDQLHRVLASDGGSMLYINDAFLRDDFVVNNHIRLVLGDDALLYIQRD